MLKVEVRNKSVPRVELDQRARYARLQLERMEQLLEPHGAVTAPWFKRVLYLLGFGDPADGSRAGQIREPLSDWRPQMPQFPRGWTPIAG
jgi:hypothetical protein